jgi:ABC-2 type transport system ATP-binding protein
MIIIRRLKKSYGKTEALRGIDLDIHSGECFGLIGPNGAGKTTTLKVLASLVKPDFGVVIIDNNDVVERPDLIRRTVGFMPDIFQCYGDTKILHYLDYFGALVGLRGRARTRKVSQVLELTDLTPKRDELVGGLSRGNKQRLCLAKTLLHNPKVLLLDEPASGLDPRARIEIRLLLTELKNMGKTIVISSHILEDLQEICDRVAIYEAGQLVRMGRVQDLVDEVHQSSRLRIHTKQAATEALAILKGHPSVSECECVNEKQIVLTLIDESETNCVLKSLLEHEIALEAFFQDKAGLADVFLDLTKGEVS